MTHYEQLQDATDKLSYWRDELSRVEREGLRMLEWALSPHGEHGVQIAPMDYIEDEYIALAEYDHQTFLPITAIRFWNGELEVFLQDYEPKHGGWTFLPSGHWIEYEEAHTDTHFILDLVIESLEWMKADQYFQEHHP